MNRFLLILLLPAALLVASEAGLAQKKMDRCEQGANTPRNWEVIGRDYVYFDYILCPPALDPPQPLVGIWITGRGEGISVEKWAQDRNGADVVVVFHGKKKAFTLYRDLNAIPLKVFKAERRSAVPEDISKQPFLAEGSSLVPLGNLTPESAERVRKVFESADTIIKTAQRRVALLHETERIADILNALEKPLKPLQ